MENGIIFLFIGQFGNQIGMKLVPCFSKDSVEDGYSFISVDTEQKTVKTFDAESHNHEKYILDKKGRGANWAMGYTLQCENEYGMPIKEIILATVKRKFEQYDYHNQPGIVMIHSLIGGTGGGLGCSVLETIKEELPNIHVTSVTTSPFISGESPMQHYNSLLTLAWLQRYADCVLIFHNDEVMNELTKLMPAPSIGKRTTGVTLDDINDYICYGIADLFHPSTLAYEQSMAKDTWENKDELYAKTKDAKTREAHSRSKWDNKKTLFNEGNNTTGLKKKSEVFKRGTYADFYQDPNKLCISNTDSIISKRKSKNHSGVSSEEKSFVKQEMKAVISKFEELECFESQKSINDKNKKIYEQLAIQKGMKFVSCKHKHSRQFTTEYMPLLKTLLSDQQRYDVDGMKYKVGAVLLSARGEYSKVVSYEEEKIEKFLRSKQAFRKSFDGNTNILASCVPITGYNSPLSISLYTNTNRIADFIEHVLYKSTILYEHSAYLHWFYRFGITNDYFEEAIQTLTDVVQEYRTI